MNSNTFMLLCPFCVKEGKTDRVQTPKHSVFVPSMFPHWVKPWDRKRGFISLKEAAARQPEFQALIQVRGGKEYASYICRDHLPVLNGAAKAGGFRIWTSPLFEVEEMRTKAQNAKAQTALGKLGSLLDSGEREALRKVGQQGDKTKAEKEAIQIAPVSELPSPEMDIVGGFFHESEVGVSAPSRRGSLKAPKAKKVAVKPGKGHKPQPRTRRQGKKNLAGSDPDQIES